MEEKRKLAYELSGQEHAETITRRAIEAASSDIRALLTLYDALDALREGRSFYAEIEFAQRCFWVYVSWDHILIS